MSTLLFADGIFDWNEAVVRIGILIVIPIALVAIGYILYALFKDRNSER